jgi:hypothetical protein
MTWLEQWRDLAARIDGLIRAGEFLVSAFKVNGADAHGVVRKSFQPELVAIIAEIEHLGQTYACELPEQASAALKKYVTQGWDKNFNDGKIDIQAFAPLASFRSQFEYLIRDAEVEGRSLTELAFVHLQRQIVVDKGIQKKWQDAFKKHETACERLGAVHLLGHGIWAFKVGAPGGATDLVFNDPVDKYESIMRRTARVLVLTEWKLINRSTEISAKAQEARTQAELYSGGVLGDAELKRTRYIVLVCDKADLTLPDDVSVGAVTYRHILLPTNPMAPSVTARRLTSRRKS